MSAVNRYIRFDDYPVREHFTVTDYERYLFAILRMCNERRVRYILGVTPMQVTGEQAERIAPVLNRGSGKAVMHGFTHGYNSPAMLAREQKAGDWGAQYRQMMNDGGEFSGMSLEEVCRRYRDADKVMQMFFPATYDMQHFIAPFNRYTEDLVLGLNDVRYIHGSDEAEYTFNHHGVNRVVSHFKFGYDYAGEVVNRLPAVLKAGEQITLHWFYDVTKRPHWKEEYVRLLDALSKEPEYVTSA